MQALNAFARDGEKMATPNGITAADMFDLTLDLVRNRLRIDTDAIKAAVKERYPDLDDAQAQETAESMKGGADILTGGFTQTINETHKRMGPLLDLIRGT